MYKSKYKKASARIARRSKIKTYFNIFVRIAVPVGILLILIFIARADFLQVQNFEVLGAETVNQEQVNQVASSFIAGQRFLVIPKSNILFLDEDKLASTLLSDFTRFEKVDIDKKFLSKRVELKITERQPEFLWCSGDNTCFLMSSDGLVFDSVGQSLEKREKIIFQGVLEGNPVLQNFATAERMQNYAKLIEVFKNNKISISAINIESEDKATADTNIGSIIFSPGEADLSTTAQNAVLLINEVRTKNPSARFQYIDARFGNKMFYKLI